MVIYEPSLHLFSSFFSALKFKHKKETLDFWAVNLAIVMQTKIFQQICVKYFTVS